MSVTNEQFVAGAVAFLVANAATLWAIGRWGVGRAIAYTHLERDVRELQEAVKSQLETNAQVQRDLKGISQKIDRRLADIEASNSTKQKV